MFYFFSVAEIFPENKRCLVQDAFKIYVAEEQPQKLTPKLTTKKECLLDEPRGPKVVKVIYKTMKSVKCGIHTFALPSKYLI